MRLITAWANVISENVILKIVLGFALVAIVALSAVTLRLSSRKPLIIERACYLRPVSIGSDERTPEEADAFIKEALVSRFDTAAQSKPGYLAQEEEKFKTQEQQELKKRDMTQRIIVGSIAVNGQTATVAADRLLSVGTVRSVLPFPVVISLGTVPRTEWNPYGLIMLRVSAPQSDAKSGDKK